MSRTADDIRAEMLKLLDEDCDCVLSIRNPTKCWRCRQIDMLNYELINYEVIQ